MSAIDKAIKLVKQFEGCKLNAYYDKFGDCWTIGYGCTGREINENTTWTQAEADYYLRSKVITANHYALDLSRNLKDHESTQAAITDFIYNLGVGTYQKSTLRILINLGRWQDASVEILKYDHADGKVLPGLTKRREAESELIA